MSLMAGQAKLEQASKKLMIRWREAQATWRDPNSKQFEEQCIMAWLTQIRKAAKAMDEMNRILNKVRDECG